MARAELDVDTLVRLLLVVVVVWISLEIIGELLGLFAWALGPLQPILGLVLVALVALYLTGRL